MPRINDKLFYSNAIKKHGLTPKGVCWLSHTHQTLRFDIILSFLPKDISSSSLVDIGCGFGDFYRYLQIQRKLPISYTPIDNIQQMCDITQQNFKIRALKLDATKDKLPNSDYYICSGALNILTPFEVVLFIQNCYRSSKKAFIFNTLYGNKKSETYNYMKKEDIRDIATSLNVKKIVYEQNYLDNDITVGFYR